MANYRVRDLPNILFIFTDQQRYDSLSCNGAPVCKTPNLDKLASEGVRFSYAYTCTSLCSPTRATFLTGLYPHNHGLLTNIDNFNGVFKDVLRDKVTVPELLKGAGYQVGYVGKWHLDEHKKKAFHDWISYDSYYNYLKQKGIDWDMARDEVQKFEFGPEAPFCGTSELDLEDNMDVFFANKTIELIDKYGEDRKRPFFIMCSFHGPHFPYVLPRPFDTLYDPSQVKRPQNFDDPYINKPKIHLKERWRWNCGHLTWPMWQNVIAHYWGYCSFLDEIIGRLVNHLDSEGLKGETVVIFTADHGDLLGNHRLFNKGFNMYEEAYHVPLIVRWPHKVQPGQECDAFVNAVDIAPTLLDIAGLLHDNHDFDGQSIVPLLERRDVEWPDDVFSEFHGYETTLYSQRMVRTKRWKYVYNPPDVDELYDLESDPGEVMNRIDDPGCEHVLREMRERMFQWMQRTNDPIGSETTWQGNWYFLSLSRRHKRAD